MSLQLHISEKLSIVDCLPKAYRLNKYQLSYGISFVSPHISRPTELLYPYTEFLVRKHHQASSMEQIAAEHKGIVLLIGRQHGV
jgi:hypothetical protein